MDGREGGYIKLHRSIESSDDFVGLRPDQCWVAVRIAMLANFKPGACRVRCGAHQHHVTIDRGELALSMETIANRTGATVKVVRTTINRLIASGYLTARYVSVSGTPSGTPIRVLRVVKYDKFNPRADESGTPPGSPTARHGHATGTPRAPIEEGEEREEGEELTLSAAKPLGEPLPPPTTSQPATTPAAPPASAADGETTATGLAGTALSPSLPTASAHDDHAGAFERVRAVWDAVCVPVGFAKPHATKRQCEKARTRMREPGWFAAFELACEYVAHEPFYRGASSSGWVLTLGWLLEPGNTEKTAERASTTRAPPQGSRSHVHSPAKAEDFGNGGFVTVR